MLKLSPSKEVGKETSTVPYETVALTGNRDMTSAKQDCVRFLRWLHELEREASENVRRFANMVLAEFDTIAATSRQPNARATALPRLARERLPKMYEALRRAPLLEEHLCWDVDCNARRLWPMSIFTAFAL